MNTTKHRVSPYQVRYNKSASVQAKPHPVREEVQKSVGTFTLTATVEEDTHTLNMFKHVQGLVAFLCTIKKDNTIIGQGRGFTVVGKMNRYIERTVHAAFNSSLVDAIIKSTKLPNSFSEHIPQLAETKEEYVSDGITDKQRMYLEELIHLNIDDEEMRSGYLSQMSELSKQEASKMIESFRR